MLTAPWFSAWEKLLTNEVAIRSSITCERVSTSFDTELLLIGKGKPDVTSGIYSIRCKRTLGLSIDLPITKIEGFRLSFETFLRIQHDRWLINRSGRLAEIYLEPLPHVATVIQFGATDQFFLPSSHPLLMLHYGMVYEGIVAREKNHSDYGYGFIWEILEHRFGAFLYQQQTLSAKATLGELIIPE